MLRRVEGAAIFSAAFLGFLLQLILAKQLLPWFGGTPAMWNLLMVFFQTWLLLGYGYAHLAPKWLGTAPHARMHAFFAFASLTLLPLALVIAGDQVSEAPITTLLSSLVMSAGGFYLMLASATPLIIGWSSAKASKAHLFTLSNAGSFAALLAYPTIIETNLTIADQQHWFGIWYIATMAMLALLALTGHQSSPTTTPSQVDFPLKRGAMVMLLGMVPSMLLHAVTRYITTDIAAVPLLWVVPLAVYLLSLMLAFQKPFGDFNQRALEGQTHMALVALAVLGMQVAVASIVHLLALLIIATAWHLLAARREPKDSGGRTAFYFWLSLGGVLGGVIINLLAPLVLQDGLTEYPIVLLLAAFLLHLPAIKARHMGLPATPNILPAFTVVLLAMAAYLWMSLLYAANPETYHFLQPLGFGSKTTPKPWIVLLVLMMGVLMLGLERRYRSDMGMQHFAFWLGGIAALALILWPDASNIYQHRNFFGVHRVRDNTEFHLRLYTHGSTVHGLQSHDPAHFGLNSYYAPLRPIWMKMEALAPRQQIAVIGMGVGTTACLAASHQHVVFFEIDPDVVSMAQNPDLFGFWHGCPPSKEVILGDGRLMLARDSRRFDLIVVDAFTSDAIPTHMLTSEALWVYQNHLTASGVIAFNISNRHLNLLPVLAALAETSNLSLLHRLINPQDAPIPKGREGMDFASHWVLLTKDPTLTQALSQSGWSSAADISQRILWTDGYTPLLPLLR